MLKYNNFYLKKNKLKAILVKKKSKLDLYKENSNNKTHNLISKNKTNIKKIKLSHEEHNKTVIYVNEILKKYKFSVVIVFHTELNNINLRNCLIISVGGDGTLLNASHYLMDSTVLGVNSDPDHSVGALCAATKKNFENILIKILKREFLSKETLRIQVFINDKKIPIFALNDILIANKNPAAISKYFLKLKDIKEQQISSGIWISTPIGSSGAISSSGGRIQSFTDQKFQIKIREPYILEKKIMKINSKLIKKTESIEFISSMTDGRIFFDGSEQLWDFSMGDHLKINALASPIKLFISKEMIEKRIIMKKTRENYMKRIFFNKL